MFVSLGWGLEILEWNSFVWLGMQPPYLTCTETSHLLLFIYLFISVNRADMS